MIMVTNSNEMLRYKAVTASAARLLSYLVNGQLYCLVPSFQLDTVTLAGWLAGWLAVSRASIASVRAINRTSSYSA